jgi:hypothetical protein
MSLNESQNIFFFCWVMNVMSQSIDRTFVLSFDKYFKTFEINLYQISEKLKSNNMSLFISFKVKRFVN